MEVCAFMFSSSVTLGLSLSPSPFLPCLVQSREERTDVQGTLETVFVLCPISLCPQDSQQQMLARGDGDKCREVSR